MRYLFGDSSESSLELNYLGFLRDAIDFGVELLVADVGLAAAQDGHDTRAQTADETVRSIEELGRATLQRAEPLADGNAPINRCAAAIVQAVGDAIKREIGRARGGLAAELQQRDADMAKHRQRAAGALTTLIATHDLPSAEETLTVTWGATSFEARMRQRAGFGLDVAVALDVPPESMFAHDLKVEKIVDGLEVHMPETAGWVKKVVKMVPHKVGRHLVTEVTSGKAGVTFLLRATHEPASAGLDVTVSDTGAVTVTRVGGTAEPAFATDDRDLAGLRSLAAKLDEALQALRSRRRALLEAAFAGTPLSTLTELRPLVERLVDAMAPVVNEIAKHSLSPHELVLRRLLGDNRREEIFLPRSELVAKLAPLPADERRVFAPLGILDAGEPAATHAPAPAPAPAPPPPEPPPESVVVAPEPELPPPPAPPPEPELPIPAVVVEAAEPPPPEPPPPPPQDPSDQIEIDADLPPVREPTPMSKPLPSIFGPRGAAKTTPPPPPRPAASDTAAAIERVLDDLGDSEPTEVVRTPPRPTRPPGST